MPSSAEIIDKAIEAGASLAGIASVEAIKNSPTYQKLGLPDWPEDARSALVLALSHPINQPQLDWWDNRRDSAGNRRLIDICKQVGSWLKEHHQIKHHPLAYAIERGGIYLKDAAALAGIGVIGKNNLLITPEFGPRVRLRAMFINQDLKPTGLIDFNPCEGCRAPCLKACPRKAFPDKIYSLPPCDRQMIADVENKTLIDDSTETDQPTWQVKYCRACELSCPKIGI